MSRNSKIALGLAGIVLVLCLCASVAAFGFAAIVSSGVAGAVEYGRTNVTETASQIAHFDLPAGYRQEFSFRLGDFLFTSFTPGDGHSHIMFMQAPASSGMGQLEMEQQMQRAFEQRGYSNRIGTRVIAQTRATVRGQEVTFLVSEGTNSEGQPFRTMTGSFQGISGPALLVIEEPVSTWNQGRIDSFIASIR